MAVEAKRGCGYRKVGAMYLVGAGMALPCFKMPYELTVCPVCGEGIRFSRGHQWVKPKQLTGGKCEMPQPYCGTCPFELEKGVLMFVGEKFYKTPQKFIEEAVQMGISKRITTIPKDIKIGEDWVLLAHKKGMQKRITVEAVGLVTQVEETVTVPAIFYAFKPTAIEKIVTQQMYDDLLPVERNEAAEKGIKFVIVPGDDRDHRGTVYDAKEEEVEPMVIPTVEPTPEPPIETVAIQVIPSQEKPKKVRKLRWRIFGGHDE